MKIEILIGKFLRKKKTMFVSLAIIDFEIYRLETGDPVVQNC